MNKLINRSLAAIAFVLSMPVLADSANCDISTELDCDARLASEQSSTLILGAGVGGVMGVPDYVGSDETRNISITFTLHQL